MLGARTKSAQKDNEASIPEMAAAPSSRKRMSRPDDARALRSREALRSALLALIEEYPFEKISIRDITKRAGLSYPVFFRRYASREELFEDIATEEIRSLLELTQPIFDSDAEHKSLEVLCGYIRDRRSLWQRLITGGAAPAMRTEFIRIAQEIGRTRERKNPWIPRDLAAPFVVSGLFEILAWWLRQPEEYPIENVVTMLDVLVVRSMRLPVGDPLSRLPLGFAPSLRP